MKILQDIVNLIEIRNFVVLSENNERIKMSKDDMKALREQVKTIDKIVIEQLVKLNLSNFGKEQQVVNQFTRESTDDTEKVMKRFAVKPVSHTFVDSKDIKVVSSNTKVDPLTGMTFIEAPTDENTQSDE